MNSSERLLYPGGVQTDAGLLVLRVLVAGILVTKHGFEKILHFSTMAQHFPDPVHIGAAPSLFIAMLGDFVCSFLIIFGLATRWAALFSLVNLFVAWALVHHFQLLGKGADHGELIFLYMASMLALALAGAGRYSLDALLLRRNRLNA